MTYENIANLVHDLVKNPENILLQGQKLSNTEQKTNESTIIQNVFSKLEVSGDVLTAGMIPEGMWG